MTTRTAFVTSFLSALPVAIERQDRAYADCTPPSTPCAVVAVMAEEVGKLAAKALHPAGQAVGAEQGAMLREQLLTIAAAACRMAALTEGVGAQPAQPSTPERPRLFIFHLAAREETTWDSFNAHVVIAADEASARALCPCGDECESGKHARAESMDDESGDTHGENQGCFWTDPARSSCTCLGVAGPQGPDPSYDRPGVVCSSFRAG